MLPSLPILFEDNHLLVVNKPFGMLSQGDSSGDLDVLTLAKAIIKERDHKPQNVYLGLVHRLDRPAGGVMVLAKTSKAAGRLSAQFRERETHKIYLAAVAGMVEQERDTLSHFLKKDPASRITSLVQSEKEGKPALCHYRVIERRPTSTLVEVELITGLPHQIRVQLSSIGHPILGDRKYGSTAPMKPGTIALFAHSITLTHPTHHTPLTVTAAAPLLFCSGVPRST